MKEELKKRYAEAVQLKEAGNLIGAREILIEVSEAGTSPATLAVLGDVCWDLKLWDEAIEAFRRAATLVPASEAVSLGLFHCLWESGRRDEAMEEIKRFTMLSGSSAYSEIVREINQKM